MKKIFTFLTILLSFRLSAGILNVPALFPTIQSAINTSVNGDTIVVDPGIYYENINLGGKNILLTSLYYLSKDTSYIYSTIINGSQPAQPDTASCILIVSGEDSTTIIQGFTITGGQGTRWTDIHGAGIYREGGGILIELSSPVIQNNLIINNAAYNTSGVSGAGGGGIRLGDGNPQILNNVIAFNTGRYGAGIVMNYSGGTIKNNLIAYNTGAQSFGGGGAMWIQNSLAGFTKMIINNTIVNNRSISTAGGLFIGSTTVVIKNNIIWGNIANTFPQIRGLGATINATYNDVAGGYTGAGNIDLNPLFTDTLGYYLINSSPCIDAGDSSLVFNDSEDILNPGFALPPSLGTLRNDMGAYGGPGAAVLPVPQALIASVNANNKPASLQLFPQPADDYCFIKCSGMIKNNIEVRLFDASMRQLSPVYSWKNNGVEEMLLLNTSQLTTGIYFVELFDGDNASVEKMIVK